MKALLVGCGNIGAFYDWDSKLVLTYAKAFKTIGIDFCVYDLNVSTASKVADRFGVKLINTLDDIELSGFDIGVISSSTSTHGFYLSKFFEASPKLIICEKPVESDITKLDKALSEYLSTSARVLVNYHRPFQPAMRKLASLVKDLHAKSTCQALVITYQRGFLNNATHAFDLLSHLFGQVFRPENINVLKKNYDEFENDPTISMTCEWIGIPVHFVGISFARFSHFDISIYFSDYLIELRRGGDRIDIYRANLNYGSHYHFLEHDQSWNECLNNYMVNFVLHSKNMVLNKDIADNFQSSVTHARTALEIIQGI